MKDGDQASGQVDAERSETLGRFREMVWRLAASIRPAWMTPLSWEIYQQRLRFRRETGRRPTFQILADHFGVTRQNINQFEARIERLGIAPFGPELDSLRERIQQAGPLVDLTHFFPNLNAPERIVAEDLLHRRAIYLDEPLQSLSLEPISRLQRRLVRVLRRFLRHRLPLGDVSEQQIGSALEDWVHLQGFATAVLPPLLRLVKSALFEQIGGIFYWRGKEWRQRELGEAILQEYPDGCAIHHEVDALRRRAEELRPGAFKTDLAILRVIMHSPHCHRWGRGVFIHAVNVRVPADSIAPVADWLSEQLMGDVPHFAVFQAFDRFAAPLGEAGVPNPYALYTCLRLFYRERFSLPRFPFVLRFGVEERVTYEESMGDFLREHGPVSRQALCAEFVGRRGWRAQQVDLTVVLSKRLVRPGRAIVALREADDH